MKFGQFGKFSANLNNIRPKSVAEIQLRFFFKTANARSLVCATDFGQTSSKFAEIRPMVGFLCADLSEIQPVWKDFGQFWR
jgi:hypothetical protein